MVSYCDTQLFIDGRWRKGGEGEIEVINPATEEVIGVVASASRDDLDDALHSAQRGFEQWSKTGVLEKSQLLRRAAALLRERVEEVSFLMTAEQGKPLAEARAETFAAADTIEWFAEESRRTYGRVIPPRSANVTQLVVKEPVGPVAAFTPWNFPLNQAVRKVSGALASGCSIILKGPEETPASCAALVKAFVDAGLPAGALNLVYGVPAHISSYLIVHPIIKKVSFTGSTTIGKQLAALAGSAMKRVTMELGGHAPALVFEDADIETAVRTLAGAKFRNAGQVCVSPTRFIVHDSVHGQFVDKFKAAADRLVVGDGLGKATQMGPLANVRRLEAMEKFVRDASTAGASVVAGGERIGNRGYFFRPTILADVPLNARVMNEEPFGPIATVSRFKTYDEAIAEANRLPYGLAAYAYTTSAKTVADVSRDTRSGMISINHHGLALPELPFGGIQESGYGSEGGTEAMESYLNTKLVTVAT
jgi:succinate-semialdehyde dehydrogenase / glutarate-semialdehyde dehydrogenase